MSLHNFTFQSMYLTHIVLYIQILELNSISKMTHNVTGK